MGLSVTVRTYFSKVMGRNEYLGIPRGSVDKYEDDGEMAPAIALESTVTSVPERRRQHIFSQRPIVRALIDALLLIIIVILSWNQIRLSSTRHVDLQGDITGYVPEFGHGIIIFKEQLEFISNHSSEQSLRDAREFWKKLVPPGQGFLDISDETAQKYDFPKLINYDVPAEVSTTGQDRSGHSLGTSVVHSIHCLYTMMAEYDLAFQGIPAVDLGHMDHCYEYLRQVIMCGADVALAGETFPGGSSQFGVAHTCKNWDEVYKYLDRNKVTTAWQFGDHKHHFVPPTKGRTR